MGIAEEVERRKARRKNSAGGKDGEGGGGEAVVLKATGKAITKVMELGLWFQQREDVYAVRMRTGSVGAIDDITMDEDGDGDGDGDGEGKLDDGVVDATVGAGDEVGEGNDVDGVQAERRGGEDVALQTARKRKTRLKVKADEAVPETRIRYTSVLEVHVSLK